MPQLNQPYTYTGEYVQLGFLAMALLVIVCFYLTPATFVTQACALVLAVAKSPLEQFAVPFAPSGSAGSFVGGIVQYGGFSTIVGIYGFLTLITLLSWILGSQVEALLVRRGWGGVVLDAAQDTSRSIVGSAHNVRGWSGAVTALLALLATANLLGNIPGGYTLTTSVVVAAVLSLSFWLWVTAESFSLQGINFWGSFIPAGTPLVLVPILAPIEAVSYVARAFSLGVRLFSNILAGHTLLAILADFMLAGLSSTWAVCLVSTLLLSLYTSLILLEIAVSVIQAYVFSVLTVSYLEGTV